MAADAARPWLVYHLEGGKMVMDEVDHIDHFMQHHSGRKGFENKIVAAVQDPLEGKFLEKLEEQYKAKLDKTARQKPAPYKAPQNAPRRPFSTRRRTSGNGVM